MEEYHISSDQYSSSILVEKFTGNVLKIFENIVASSIIQKKICKPVLISSDEHVDAWQRVTSTEQDEKVFLIRFNISLVLNWIYSKRSIYTDNLSVRIHSLFFVININRMVWRGLHIEYWLLYPVPTSITFFFNG